MARTPITVTAVPALYTAAVENNLPVVVADASNDNSIVSTGRDILIIAYNSGVTDDLTVTIVGASVSPYGDIQDAVMTVDGGEYAFLRIPPVGYVQSDGTIHINTTSTDISLISIQL